MSAFWWVALTVNLVGWTAALTLGTVGLVWPFLVLGAVALIAEPARKAAQRQQP